MFRVEKFLGSKRVSRKLAAAFMLVIGLMAAASIVGLVTTRSNLPRLDYMVKDPTLKAQSYRLETSLASQ